MLPIAAAEAVEVDLEDVVAGSVEVEEVIAAAEVIAAVEVIEEVVEAFVGGAAEVMHLLTTDGRKCE